MHVFTRSLHHSLYYYYYTIHLLFYIDFFRIFFGRLCCVYSQCALLHSIYSIAIRLMHDICHNVQYSKSIHQTHSNCQCMQPAIVVCWVCIKNCLLSIVFDTANGNSNAKTMSQHIFALFWLIHPYINNRFFLGMTTHSTNTITMQTLSVLPEWNGMEWEAKLVFKFESVLKQ